MTIRPSRRLWQPPNDTIDAIAAALNSHWAAAKSLHPQSLFNAAPVSWLRRQATRLIDSTPVAGSAADAPTT